jgi:hypothetical protein
VGDEEDDDSEDPDSESRYLTQMQTQTQTQGEVWDDIDEPLTRVGCGMWRWGKRQPNAMTLSATW